MEKKHYTHTPQMVKGLMLSQKAWASDFDQFCTKNMLACEVVFGSPQMNCRGSGICRLIVHAATEQASSNCRRNPAFLMPAKDGKCLAVVFRRELLCVNVLRTQFRNGQMILKESFRIPQPLMETLSLKKKFLKAGTYSLEQVDGHFLIRFDCT